MRHVFQKSNALASVEDLIEAQEKEEYFQEVLQRRFTYGNRSPKQEKQINWQKSQQEESTKSIKRGKRDDSSAYSDAKSPAKKMDITSFTNAAIRAGKKHSTNPEKKGKLQKSRSNTAN